MITEEDLKRFKAFKRVVLQTKADVKLDAAIMVASLTKWFLDLEERMETYLEEKEKAEKNSAAMASGKIKKEVIKK